MRRLPYATVSFVKYELRGFGASGTYAEIVEIKNGVHTVRAAIRDIEEKAIAEAATERAKKGAHF
jgi:hypothetical protein